MAIIEAWIKASRATLLCGSTALQQVIAGNTEESHYYALGRQLAEVSREKTCVSEKAGPRLDGLGAILGAGVNILPSSSLFTHLVGLLVCVESVKRFSPLTSQTYVIHTKYVFIK